MVLDRRAWLDDTRFPWGEHRGKKIRDVPATYLVWLLDQRWISEWPGLFKWLKLNETRLREELAAVPADHRIPDDFNSFQDYLNDRRGF